jgi:hypothetical protein
MDEQHNGFDQPAEPTGPETDDNPNSTEAAPGATDKPRAPAGREMLTQLQQMIDTVALQTAPVMREVAAKAAELAGVAGEKAGPLAHRAADVTEHIGQRLAARSKNIAADLRRPREDEPPSDGGNAGPDGMDGPGGGGDSASHD